MTRTRQLGFTLLEVLLVALLMGLSAMAVTLTLNNSGPKQVVDKLAKQFLATTEMVIDQAVLSGSFIGIVVDDNKYQFVYYEDKKWQPIKLDRIATEKKLDDGIKMSLVLDGMPLVQDDEQEDSWFDEPFIEAKSEEDKKKNPQPQILLFPSGELTPFELSFIIKEQNKEVIVEVSGDAMGRLTLGRFDDFD
ncbi:type II secretion system minor pseudopilin GspH [Shewanella intestini]|uniref:Type II secretion system protein H n=1 Tax=Shewanella intestini TaxID=2017544 RepID=A0ABS5I5P1_9GAMM|nr:MULTISPECIES: type II secretion system minor pseudopilin GspH [Shewanella]MBR9729349.1 type II secretion system minor pseudopilin GspH [Shewanella intestini]MRG37428.1 type II secretion system protein GspH [Shewanella sp. XMDDZSB0408]